jgi:hypothetical protein
LVPKVHAGFQELFHAQFNCHMCFQVSSSEAASRCVGPLLRFVDPVQYENLAQGELRVKFKAKYT